MDIMRSLLGMVVLLAIAFALIGLFVTIFIERSL